MPFYKLDMWKLHITSLQYCWKQDICHCILHLCQKSSSTFEQEHVFLPSKSFSSSSAATGARCSAVPHLTNNDVLTGCLLKDKQMKTWCYEIRTVGQVQQLYIHPTSVMASVVHTLMCGLALSWRNNTSDICGTNLTEVSAEILSVSM
jgi:hypothetical protein